MKNDVEKLFVQDSKEKKRTARGFHNMNRTGKGAVKFPSDYLTAKERAKLNGPVVTYDMGKPMKWKDFKKMPTPMQNFYLKGLMEKFHPSQAMVAEMFQVNRSTAGNALRDAGIRQKRGGPSRESAAWAAWLKGEEAPAEETPIVEEPVAVPEEPVAVPEEPVAAPEEPVVEELVTVRRPAPVSVREHILARAKECVMGDREQDYGSPENNFRTIADMWNAYLGTHWITPKDVAAMLALLKIARIASGHSKQDNWIDLAGYAACGGELEDGERK